MPKFANRILLPGFVYVKVKAFRSFLPSSYRRPLTVRLDVACCIWSSSFISREGRGGAGERHIVLYWPFLFSAHGEGEARAALWPHCGLE